MHGYATSSVAIAGAVTSLLMRSLKKRVSNVGHEVYAGLSAMVTLAVSWVTSWVAVVELGGERLTRWGGACVVACAVAGAVAYVGYMAYTSPGCVWRMEGVCRSCLCRRLSTGATYTVKDVKVLSALSVYIQSNPSHFPTIRGMETVGGDVAHLTSSNNASVARMGNSLVSLVYPKLGVTHPVQDRKFAGSMVWNYRDVNVNAAHWSAKTESWVKVPMYMVTLSSKTHSLKEILDYLEHVKQQSRRQVLKKPTGITVLSSENEHLFNHYHILPSLPALAAVTDEVLAQHAFSSFFHPRRDQLLMMLRSIHEEEETLYAKGFPTTLGVIAHGPPGCGKSLLGYKAARALGRVPYVVDLLYKPNTGDAYKLMFNPTIHGVETSQRDVVVILDEFDETVRQLARREKRKDGDHSDDHDDGPWCMEGVEESKETKTPAKASGQTDVRTDPRVRAMEVIEAMMSKKEQMGKKMRRALTVESLLRLLQGPVPHDGSIIVATTNRLDAIRKVNEALVRPGRLTPIEFDYPGRIVVDQMSRHYFGVPFEEDIPTLVGTPVSELTALALSLRAEDNPAAAFHKWVMDAAHLSVPEASSE